MNDWLIRTTFGGLLIFFVSTCLCAISKEKERIEEQEKLASQKAIKKNQAKETDKPTSTKAKIKPKKTPIATQKNAGINGSQFEKSSEVDSNEPLTSNAGSSEIDFQFDAGEIEDGTGEIDFDASDSLDDSEFDSIILNDSDELDEGDLEVLD